MKLFERIQLKFVLMLSQLFNLLPNDLETQIDFLIGTVLSM